MDITYELNKVADFLERHKHAATPEEQKNALTLLNDAYFHFMKALTCLNTAAHKPTDDPELRGAQNKIIRLADDTEGLANEVKNLKNRLF